MMFTRMTATVVVVISIALLQAILSLLFFSSCNTFAVVSQRVFFPFVVLCCEDMMMSIGHRGNRMSTTVLQISSSPSFRT